MGEQWALIRTGAMDTAAHAKKIVDPKLVAPSVLSVKEFGLPTAGITTCEDLVEANACR